MAARRFSRKRFGRPCDSARRLTAASPRTTRPSAHAVHLVWPFWTIAQRPARATGPRTGDGRSAAGNPFCSSRIRLSRTRTRISGAACASGRCCSTKRSLVWIKSTTQRRGKSCQTLLWPRSRRYDGATTLSIMLRSRSGQTSRLISIHVERYPEPPGTARRRFAPRPGFPRRRARGAARRPRAKGMRM